MGIFTSFGLFLPVLFLVQTPHLCLSQNLSAVCIEAERQALVKFKQGLKDPSLGLSSWQTTNCCRWKGVTCNTTTGHVIKLDLGRQILNISDSGHVHLDLSWNGFEDGFETIPWNTCKMKTLVLSKNRLDGRSLGNQRNFSTCLDYDLEELSLSSNKFTGHLPDQLRRLKKLKHLFLSDNSFNGSIPTWIGELSALTKLYLPRNQLNGEIPDSVGQLLNLEELDLQSNQLNGKIPDSLGQLLNQEKLDLSGNQLNGEIPDSLGQLLNLEILYLYDNSLEGIISEVHFANLSRLKELDIGSNQLVIKLKSNWIPPFQLEFIGMDFCKIGTQLPQWLGTQKQATYVVLSNASIIGPILQWFQDMHFLEYLDLSHNFIFGTLPQNIDDMMPSLRHLLVADNLINGTIPNSFCNMGSLFLLDLSDNNFSGNIPNCWKEDTSDLVTINLSSNKLTGTIPTSIGHLSSLSYLDLNNNSLEGELPLALRSCTQLIGLDLSDNHLTGTIPENIENLTSLESLDLSTNQLSGTIPRTMSDITSLRYLNLSNNNLSGQIPVGGQLQAFTDPSYAANPQLCGAPLPKKCQLGNEPPQYKEDSEEEEKNEKVWFYMVVIVGYTTGLSTVVGVLLLNKIWRFAYFQFVDRVKEWILLTIALKTARLKKKMIRRNHTVE